MADAHESGKAMGKVIARALEDPGLHDQLKSDPAGTLKAHGVDLPAGVKVNVHQIDDKNMHLVLPAKPAGQISDEHLSAVAGGGTTSSAGTAGSAACPVSSAGTAGTAGSAGD